MGLHDRIKGGNGSGPGDGNGEAPPIQLVGAPARDPEPERPHNDPYAELKTRIHHACIAKLGPQLFTTETNEDLHEQVHERSPSSSPSTGRPSPRRTPSCRPRADGRHLGYGPLEPLLRDDDVTEVMVNNFDRIFIERAGKIERTDATFADNAHLLRIIDKIVSQVGAERWSTAFGRQPSERDHPAARGPTLTIRKFSRDPYTMDDLIAFDTLTAKSAQFLAACVRGKLNVLISGGTGTGKTTTLNAVSAFIPGDERIVTIEDAAELQLQQEHVITLEARPPNIEGQGEVRIRELVRNALRMRPDRIIVGEVRGAETLDMLQAMNTGHEGSLTTIHANSPRDALSRLETLVLTAGVDLPSVRSESRSRARSTC